MQSGPVAGDFPLPSPVPACLQLDDDAVQLPNVHGKDLSARGWTTQDWSSSSGSSSQEGSRKNVFDQCTSLTRSPACDSRLQRNLKTRTNSANYSSSSASGVSASDLIESRSVSARRASDGAGTPMSSFSDFLSSSFAARPEAETTQATSTRSSVRMFTLMGRTFRMSSSDLNQQSSNDANQRTPRSMGTPLGGRRSLDSDNPLPELGIPEMHHPSNRGCCIQMLCERRFRGLEMFAIAILICCAVPAGILFTKASLRSTSSTTAADHHLGVAAVMCHTPGSYEREQKASEAHDDTRVRYPNTKCPCTPSSGESDGVIKDSKRDPGHKYASNMSCQWTISSTDNSTLIVRFLEFETQYRKDVMRVFECEDPASSIRTNLAELTGILGTTGLGEASDPQVFDQAEYVSTKGCMQLEFSSDGSNEASGFHAVWFVEGHPLYPLSTERGNTNASNADDARNTLTVQHIVILAALVSCQISIWVFLACGVHAQHVQGAHERHQQQLMDRASGTLPWYMPGAGRREMALLQKLLNIEGPSAPGTPKDTPKDTPSHTPKATPKGTPSQAPLDLSLAERLSRSPAARSTGSHLSVPNLSAFASPITAVTPVSAVTPQWRERIISARRKAENVTVDVSASSDDSDVESAGNADRGKSGDMSGLAAAAWKLYDESSFCCSMGADDGIRHERGAGFEKIEKVSSSSGSETRGGQRRSRCESTKWRGRRRREDIGSPRSESGMRSSLRKSSVDGQDGDGDTSEYARVLAELDEVNAAIAAAERMLVEPDEQDEPDGTLDQVGGAMETEESEETAAECEQVQEQLDRQPLGGNRTPARRQLMAPDELKPSKE